jgi:hypothetical protein
LGHERERRGISLETLAAVTKVSADLWEGLERNDFSRWPSGIFARAFVRDYARAVGLDSDEVVDEFCRLFPIGDRRAARLIQAHAELIGHRANLAEEAGGLPPQGERRRSPGRRKEDSERARRPMLGPRAIAAAIDTCGALMITGAIAFLLQVSFWSSAGAITLAYYGAGTVLLGTTAGTRVVDILRQRVPALFSVLDRRRATA